VSQKVTITYPTALILQALANGYRHGFDIMDITGLPSGTVYPALRRLERTGIAKSNWEDAEIAQGEQRPARRYYELTASGEETLQQAVARYRLLASTVPLAKKTRRTARG
jgi:DNA-binding PadR family transcriptional regulator